MTTARVSLAIVGAGNFAKGASSLLTSLGLPPYCFVDEQHIGAVDSTPVLQAQELTTAHQQQIDKYLIAISDPSYQKAAVKRLLAQGISAGRVFNLEDDPSIQMLGFLFRHNATGFVQNLISSKIKTMQQLENALLAKRWKQTRDKLNPDVQSIALGYYGRGGGFRKHISPLVPYLNKDYNVITLSDEQCDQVGEAEHHLYMSATTAAKTPLADLMLSAHIFPCAPAQVPRVSFSHTIYDFNLTSAYHAQRINQPDIHYLFASSKASFHWYQALIDRYQLTNRLCIIPGGYIHLDQNQLQHQRSTHTPDSLIYAPTLSLADYPGAEEATSINKGAQLLRILTEQFPDKKIIFRPHPSDLLQYLQGRKHPRRKAFETALSYCQQHPRCTIDKNPVDYMNSYSRSALLISDTSSTAFTFAFTTGRPVVFFSPNETHIQTRYANQFQFLDDRKHLGEIITELDLVADGIRQLLETTDQTRLSIERLKSREIFNSGNACQYFTENLEYILAGEKHPDWTYINW